MDFIFAVAPVPCPSGNSSALVDATGLPKTCANQGTINTVFFMVFAVIGALALLFMVIAGARYALSKGEPDNIQKAKNEIKYSLIGLVVAAMGAAFVNFVLGRL